MKSQLSRSPKLLLAGEGELFQMLNLTFTQKINSDNTQGAWVMHEITGCLGEGAPLHSHPWAETFYVLDGEVEVQVGNRKATATPGTLMHVPENVAHSFGISSPISRMLEIIPASAEGFYRETGEKVPTLPPDLEVFQAICQKYNVRLF